MAEQFCIGQKNNLGQETYFLLYVQRQAGEANEGGKDMSAASFRESNHTHSKFRRTVDWGSYALQ